MNISFVCISIIFFKIIKYLCILEYRIQHKKLKIIGLFEK